MNQPKKKSNNNEEERIWNSIWKRIKSEKFLQTVRGVLSPVKMFQDKTKLYEVKCLVGTYRVTALLDKPA